MKRSMAMAALFFLAGAMALASSSTGPLDGKSFTGTMAKQGAKSGDKDTFVFQNGRFRSVACDAYGFGDAPYAAQVSGGVTKFHAETTSEKEGRMRWTGTVKGNSLEGQAIWEKPGADPVTFTARGSVGHGSN